MNKPECEEVSISGYVTKVKSQFILADRTKTPVIYVDSDDFPGVVRAANDLCKDIANVTQIQPITTHEHSSNANVIVGTIGRSAAIDAWISEGKLDVSDIVGKWECFTIQIVEQSVVITGSDQRGTIFGVYDLCGKIGVSPWYWWADVVPQHAEGLYLTLETAYTEYEPTVKYRGIFLNDEYALHNWAIHHGDVDYVELYKRLYELMLRLKANYIWPAMHSYSPHFHKNPINAEHAGLYGIVVGSSHCEMFLRNNLCEFFEFETDWEKRNPEKTLYKTILSDAPSPCSYVYVDAHPETGKPVYNKELLKAYWRESVTQFGTYENIYTMGMRGLHDARWQPIGLTQNSEKAALLEEIIEVQRGILEEALGKESSTVPQLFIPYKEIQEIYDSGMKLPEDITLMWTDDNYGYIRQLPTNDNRDRVGGAGIYYHLSYHGYPNSYIWLCTTPFALIREEMSKAYDYGARQVWVANVGDLKPAEKQVEYWLDLARDVHTMRNKDLRSYISEKAIRDFGFQAAEAQEYADIELAFQELAYAKKPEFFGADSFNFEGYGMTKEELEEALANKPPFVLEPLFQYDAFGDEGQQFLARYQDLVERSETLYDSLDERLQPAFYQLQLYPLRASSHVVKKYIYAVKSHDYVREGRGTVGNYYAVASDAAYHDLVQDTQVYNGLLLGKWAHIMDPFQTFFRSCGAGLPKLLDTSKATGHHELGVTSEMMTFSGYTKDKRFIDIYNVGYNPITWTATVDQPFILIEKTSGHVLQQERVWISVDWEGLEPGTYVASVTVSHLEGESVVKTMQIPLVIHNHIVDLPEHTYAEGNGYVSIKTPRYSASTNYESYKWLVEKNLSRNGDSLKAYPHLAQSVLKPDITNTAYVEYAIHFETVGTFEVDIYRIPTLNERGDLRFAIGLDECMPTLLTGNNVYMEYSDRGTRWGQGVLENNEILTTKVTVTESGIHRLRVYLVDPGVILDKIVIWTQGRVPSYFGPPESYHSTLNR